MDFNKLVDFWTAVVSDSYDFENKEFALAYKKANANFDRMDIPGGCPLSSNQKPIVIDEDIEAFVDGKSGGTGWDNFINFRPITRKSKAARIAAKRKLTPNVPESIFGQSIKTRFGWELIQLPINWNRFVGVVLRPRLTKYNNLSYQHFAEWVRSFDLEKDQNEILLGLSGPRREAFISIVLGDNWKTRCYSI